MKTSYIINITYKTWDEKAKDIVEYIAVIVRDKPITLVGAERIIRAQERRDDIVVVSVEQFPHRS